MGNNGKVTISACQKKRERQLGREAALESQGELFGDMVKSVESEEVSRGIAETVLLEDFGKVLGGKGRINFMLPQLSRLGLIERRNKTIYEGPLLDLVFDYAQMAPRVIQGALGDLMRAKHPASAHQEPQKNV